MKHPLFRLKESETGEPKPKKSHFRDKPPEVAKFFIMLGRGILQKTKIGNCYLLSLKKTDIPSNSFIPLPPVEEVVRVLRLPTKERNKEEISNISRYFAEK